MKYILLLFLPFLSYSQTPMFGKKMDEIIKTNKEISYMLYVTETGIPYLEYENENRIVRYFFENKLSYLYTIQFIDDDFYESFRLKIYKEAKSIDADDWVTSFDGKMIYIHEFVLDGDPVLYYSEMEWKE